MNNITSSQNPVVKEVKSLKQRKYREQDGLFFIEGIRFVEEAIKEKAEIVKVLVSESLTQNSGGEELLSRVNEDGYETFLLPDKLFNEISDTESPQGILAVIRMKRYELSDILNNSNFLVMLDCIQDPGNLGTIIRTADAAGVDGVIISKGCVDLYNPKVLRSTMGSVFHVPVCFSEDLEESIKTVRAKGIKVFGAHLKGTSNYFELDLASNAALIIGNEANGISDEVASLADSLTRIPMIGRSESLNASIAAGLLMYEVVRQRMAGSK